MGKHVCHIEIKSGYLLNTSFVFFTTILIVFLSILFGSGAALGNADNFGLGHINLRSQSPVQSLRYTLPLQIPFKSCSGGSIRLSSTWSNVWANESEFLLDYEMADTIITVSYALSRRLLMSVEFENRNYFGGSMDGFIQGFHDLFGIDQDGRDDASKNRKVIQLFDPKTGQVTNEISANELENQGLSLLVNYNVMDGNDTWPAVNFFGSIRYGLECADICTESHPIDFGVGIGFAKRWSRRWHTFASVGLALYESRETRKPSYDTIPVAFEDETLSGLFAIS